MGLAIDAAGRLFIADQDNQRIRRVDLTGTITTVSGNGTTGFSGDGGPATAAQLNIPANVAVDAVGNLFIADLGSQRIRRVDPTGIITTVAGTGFPGGSPVTVVLRQTHSFIYLTASRLMLPATSSSPTTATRGFVASARAASLRQLQGQAFAGY